MTGKNGAGKGDSYRKVDWEKYSKNYDMIFNKKGIHHEERDPDCGTDDGGADNRKGGRTGRRSSPKGSGNSDSSR